MRCVTLPVKSDAVDIKTLREYVAKRVIEFLEQNVQIPSEARVLCFLDDRAVAELKAAFGGAANRGFHWPIRGQDSVTG
jgi:hypothetical protein